jgi:hypothetical protein
VIEMHQDKVKFYHKYSMYSTFSWTKFFKPSGLLFLQTIFFLHTRMLLQNG